MEDFSKLNVIILMSTNIRLTLMRMTSSMDTGMATGTGMGMGMDMVMVTITTIMTRNLIKKNSRNSKQV